MRAKGAVSVLQTFNVLLKILLPPSKAKLTAVFARKMSRASTTFQYLVRFPQWRVAWLAVPVTRWDLVALSVHNFCNNRNTETKKDCSVHSAYISHLSFKGSGVILMLHLRKEDCFCHLNFSGPISFCLGLLFVIWGLLKVAGANLCQPPSGTE